MDFSACTIDPTGSHLYAPCLTSQGGWTLDVFTIDPSSHGLTRTTSIPTGTNPLGLVLDASGCFGFLSNLGSNYISDFALDASGALSPNGSTVNGPDAAPGDASATSQAGWCVCVK
jgi:hypothetical protein